ncbi:MAG TPA: nucleotidyltransferase family protein [Calditrichia bacterium]|nr:nucleotidyltransferase family protein [Calditrichia bacterium]
MTKKISPFLIHPDTTVKIAMKQLDQTAEKILFVVDDQEKLVGSLSDGDIRRWILADGGLEKNITEVCNRNPVFFHQDFEIEDVKTEMISRRIECVPVVGKGRKVTELLFWEEVFGGRSRQVSVQKTPLSCPVVIMAGGKGTRLDPFTRILPKPLIPIGNKPIIEIIIDKFRPYGIDRFFVSVNHKSRIIKSYFEEEGPDYHLNYLEETKPLGTGGALKFLEGSVSGSFFVTNCDIIIEADYSDIWQFHQDNKNAITIVASMKHFNIPYGVCEIKNGGTLKEIREKPEFSFLVNTGMYLVDSKVLPLIPEDSFFHLTHLIEKAQEAKLKVKVFPISEKAWIDTGEWSEYRKALELIKL